MQKLSLEQELKNNAYPGRGIVIGKSPNGKYAVTAYFIMGRSENSRNRVFVNDGEGIRTQALRTREFEPDGPNYTPRISGIMHVENGEYNYAMSILKSNNGNPDACNRYTFAYENPVAGEGHFIHTYMCDGNPLPSFEGEPKWIETMDDMNAFADMLWESLNEDNKVSLFVRYIDIETGKYESIIKNKNK